MDPAALIPTPDAIPVSWVWFQFFLFLTFFIHILLMNVMVGTGFIALVSHLRGHLSTPCSEAVSRSLPFLVAFTVNFGVAPLLFVQVLYGHFMYTSSILMAVFWLSVVALVVVAYTLTYVYKDRYVQLGRFRLLVLGLTIILLLSVAFFFVNNLNLMQTPASWSGYFDQPHGLLLNLEDPMLVPRFLHFMTAAIAIGGLAIALWFHWRRSRGDLLADGWITHGCRWFSSATLVNSVIGLWFLVALPTGTLTVTNTTGLALLLCLGSGIVFAIPAVLYSMSNRVLPAVGCTLMTLTLMLLARSLLRTTLLAPWFSVEQLPVNPAPSPLLFFLLLLTAGIGLIVWIVRFSLRSCADHEARP